MGHVTKAGINNKQLLLTVGPRNMAVEMLLGQADGSVCNNGTEYCVFDSKDRLATSRACMHVVGLSLGALYTVL